MTDTIDKHILNELLKTQRKFDDRIEGKNISDTCASLVIEFTEWANTVEFFKNWKKNPGKDQQVQIEELADMLAFTLSKMIISGHNAPVIYNTVISFVNEYDKHGDDKDKVRLDSETFLMYLQVMTGTFMDEITDRAEEDSLFINRINVIYSLPFLLAKEYYTLEQLFEAYTEKMRVNHERQDGKADKEKGYT